MTPATIEKCKEVEALISKGMLQKDALQKVQLGTATISRYRASLRTSKPTPIGTHGFELKAEPRASLKPEKASKSGRVLTISTDRRTPIVDKDIQLALYEREVKRLRIINEKLNEIIAAIMGNV